MDLVGLLFKEFINVTQKMFYRKRFVTCYVFHQVFYKRLVSKITKIYKAIIIGSSDPSSNGLNDGLISLPIVVVFKC